MIEQHYLYRIVLFLLSRLLPMQKHLCENYSHPYQSLRRKQRKHDVFILVVRQRKLTIPIYFCVCVHGCIKVEHIKHSLHCLLNHRIYLTCNYKKKKTKSSMTMFWFIIVSISVFFIIFSKRYGVVLIVKSV